MSEKHSGMSLNSSDSSSDSTTIMSTSAKRTLFSSLGACGNQFSLSYFIQVITVVKRKVSEGTLRSLRGRRSSNSSTVMFFINPSSSGEGDEDSCSDSLLDHA